ncbi:MULTISPECIES: tRNA1(Val) (adenine(37)-N6)-methyltransferase [unclassified Treponema]|uniref:tRNA1(Val) (adenine(37)-N6)-methyltransferase n=1 Tax=unclassified Treponema TaxID=2638727 RepID=UPI0025D9AFD3|nr:MULTISPECIES: tRNA1(Val) (adenine(37)-N6)-methyltransferase [unclassified Treponema]
MNLKAGETIENLHAKPLKLIQGKKEFRFGIDAVLLSDFAHTKGKCKVCDLGTGTGIIPLLMSEKNPKANFECIEIQKESADMASRSVEMNNLQEKIKVFCTDIKEPFEVLQKNSFDAVVSNPPYIEVSNGNTNKDDPLSIARHEIFCTLEDVIKTASALLKSHGKFFLIHKSFRLPQIFSLLEKYKLAPKRMKLVFPNKEKEASMVLLESEKCAKPYLKIESPITIYGDDGKYTNQIEKIYGRN